MDAVRGANCAACAFCGLLRGPGLLGRSGSYLVASFSSLGHRAQRTTARTRWVGRVRSVNGVRPGCLAAPRPVAGSRRKVVAWRRKAGVVIHRIRRGRLARIGPAGLTGSGTRTVARIATGARGPALLGPRWASTPAAATDPLTGRPDRGCWSLATGGRRALRMRRPARRGRAITCALRAVDNGRSLAEAGTGIGG